MGGYMTVIRADGYAPIFYFNTSDLIGGDHFAGSQSWLGAKAYNTDTKLWYYIKVDGTLGAYMDVPVTAVPFRPQMDTPLVTPVLTVHATYVANDYVGTSVAPMTFENCANGAGYGGYLVSGLLMDSAKQNALMELWVFDTSAITIPADSAPWDCTDADLRHLVCVMNFATYYASASNSVAKGIIDGGSARYQCGAALTTLYGALVNRSAGPAWASGDLSVKLTLVPD
jgi:hypothetical protein